MLYNLWKIIQLYDIIYPVLAISREDNNWQAGLKRSGQLY